ncbi:MAG: hypothetical protein JNN01_26015, partial [Opitutaceae bacterium]|nr:hypothetical protein [Opitutaceae bacterium]
MNAVVPHLLLLAGLSLLGIRTLAADDFRPGAVWKDTAGRPINAHGGGLLWHDGTYYWYGEIKSGLTWLPKVNKSWGGTRVIAGGVSVYASKDLVNWTDVGVALPVRPREPDHDLSP